MRKVLIAVFVAGLLAFCAFTQTAQAQAIEVCPPTGNLLDCNSYTKISDAVTDAVPNSVIYLANGVYPESGIVIANKDLTIRGEDPRQTIVQAAAEPCTDANPQRVFRIVSARVRLENITIANGCVLYTQTPDLDNPPIGAGIWNAGSLTLKHVIVQGNNIKYDSLPVAPGTWLPMGAGIYSVGSLQIVNSAIISNVVNSPGNRAMGGGIYNNGDSYIVNSTISGNQAMGAGDVADAFLGGGIYNAGKLVMEYSTVVLNSAQTHGGGLYSTGEKKLVNNLFYGNSSPGGEAVCIQPILPAQAAAEQSPAATSCDDVPVMGTVYLGDHNGEAIVPVYTPAPGSDSIDRGICALSSVKVDQMNNRRGQGAECDLGAMEAGIVLMPMTFTAPAKPDLIVRSVTVKPAGDLTAGTKATVEIVIQNIGTRATAGSFYTDLFINPRETPPNHAGYTWIDLCRDTYCRGDEGIVWRAPLTIYPGESFTFTSDLDLDTYAVRESSQWDKYFAEGEVKLWVFVDSYEVNRSRVGNVLEIDEGNNRYEVPAFTVLPGQMPPFAVSSAAQQPAADLFAPRPQP